MSEPRNCESNLPAKAYQQLRYNERETKKKKTNKQSIHFQINSLKAFFV